MSNTPAVQLVAVLDHSVEKDSHAQLTKDKCCDGSAMAQEEQWQVLCASDTSQPVLHTEKLGLRIEIRVDFPAFPIALPQVFTLVPLRT